MGLEKWQRQAANVWNTLGLRMDIRTNLEVCVSCNLDQGSESRQTEATSVQSAIRTGIKGARARATHAWQRNQIPAQGRNSPQEAVASPSSPLGSCFRQSQAKQGLGWGQADQPTSPSRCESRGRTQGSAGFGGAQVPPGRWAEFPEATLHASSLGLCQQAFKRKWGTSMCSGK